MLRSDLKRIADLITPGSTVLDVGCGDGALLEWLKQEKQVDGRGMELETTNVSRAIARGLSVIQGNADTDLSDYPAGVYDYVILSKTIQTLHDPKAVLKHLVRIGKYAIVSIPNFGYWKNRLYLTFKGRMPVTKSLPYSWYNTPNIHFCTIKDFILLSNDLEIEIKQKLYIYNTGISFLSPSSDSISNILSDQAIFVLRKSS